MPNEGAYQVDQLSATEPRWSSASRKRHLLAVYLDYLFFGALWTLGAWALAASAPASLAASFALNLAVFLALETLLIAVGRWSPGHYCLGIIASRRRGLANPDDAESKRSGFLVDPRLSAHERWWTVLFGVLAILDGVKGITRWTMWHAPMPLMGAQVSSEASAVVQILIGLAEVAVGIAVLRLNRVAVPLGFVACAGLLVSVILSWPLLPGWIEEYVIARRSDRGLSPRPGEVDFMQTIPISMLAAPLAAAGWLILIGRRTRRDE